MTDEEMRIAVAECCGWAVKHATRELIVRGNDTGFFLVSPHGDFRSGSCYKSDAVTVADFTMYLPDYPADLNAMHEAEKMLNSSECWEYNRELQNILGVAAGKGTGFVDEWQWHATARQRCEAFLKCKNLWKP